MSVKKAMDQFITFVEGSSYESVSNENDGRGLTCGIVGVTTSDGDCLALFRRYNKPLLNTFIPILEQLEEGESDSTKELDKLGFIQAWKAACKDPDFIKAQDGHRDEVYFYPAVSLALEYFGAPSWFVVLCLYDASIMQGTGDYPDSLNDMLERAVKKDAGSGHLIESFQSVRRSVLLNPSDKKTKKEWSEAVGRVDELNRIYKSGNYDLKTPFEINPWGDDQPFVITG